MHEAADALLAAANTFQWLRSNDIELDRACRVFSEPCAINSEVLNKQQERIEALETKGQRME